MIFLLATGRLHLFTNVPGMLIVGFLMRLSMVTMNYSIKLSIAPYVNMLGVSVPVVTAIVAFFLLGYRLNWVQMMGAAIIVMPRLFVHKGGV